MFDLDKFSIKLADNITKFIGSWTFIIVLSIFLIIWVILNVTILTWDPYPFILMNLFLSFQAAYATPLILMAANRSAERDRKHAMKDFKVDKEAHDVVFDIQEVLNTLRKEVAIDKKALADHHILKDDHKRLENDLVEIKKMLAVLTNTPNEFFIKKDG